MDLEKYQELLSECEEELICFVCKECCKSPVRLNKCGHYFCEICISRSLYDNICPKCKEVYSIDDISTTHFFGKVQNDIQFFKVNLESLTNFVSILSKNKIIAYPNNCTVSADLPFTVKFTDPKSFKRNAKGESKLHLACKRKNCTEVSQLIENDVDINLKDYACWTPLHEAIQAEDVDIVEKLLSHGALINSPGEFYVTPLHKAVLVENKEIIILLVEFGADKEPIDFHGRKPMDCTKRKDLLDVLNNTEIKKNVKTCVFIVNQVVAYCHSIDEDYKNKITSMKNSIVLQDFDIKTQIATHLIVKKSHKVSLKILLSMLGGLIIVRQEWIDDYMKGIMDIPTEPVLENNFRISKGIRTALINHLMNKPKLFDGIKFYIEVTEILKIYELPITKDFLKLLISVGGGDILCRAPAPRTVETFRSFPFHADSESSVYGCTNIIIFHDEHPPKLQYKMKELQHKPSKWLIDCALNFSLI